MTVDNLHYGDVVTFKDDPTRWRFMVLTAGHDSNGLFYWVVDLQHGDQFRISANNQDVEKVVPTYFGTKSLHLDV